MKNFILLLFLFFMTTQGYSQDQKNMDKYSYLIKTTNAIFEIHSKSMDLDEEQLIEITARACNTLKRLQNDPNFKQDLEKMVSLLPDYQDQQKELSRNLTQFLDSFLRPEIELLQEAGLSETAIIIISNSQSYLHESLNETVTPEEILASLDELQNEICTAAEDLNEAREERINKKRMWGNITRWAKGIGGLSVIVINAGGSVPTGTLSTASFTLGGVLLGSAMTSEE